MEMSTCFKTEFRIALATGFGAAALGSMTLSAGAQTLPNDAQPRCAVSQTTFASWFQSGNPMANGVVNPANGLTFPNAPNCSFYQWAAQMFLWLTSPAPSVYGGGSRIFQFADVLRSFARR